MRHHRATPSGAPSSALPRKDRRRRLTTWRQMTTTDDGCDLSAFVCVCRHMRSCQSRSGTGTSAVSCRLVVSQRLLRPPGARDSVTQNLTGPGVAKMKEGPLPAGPTPPEVPSAESQDLDPLPAGTTAHDRLKGWKQIGSYLDVSDRTVQRWEEALGLPIHRIDTARSAVVFASKRELDAWERSAAGRTARGLAASEGEPAPGDNGAHEAEPPRGEVDAGPPGQVVRRAVRARGREDGKPHPRGLPFRCLRPLLVLAVLALSVWTLYYLGVVPSLSTEQRPDQERIDQSAEAGPAATATPIPRSVLIQLTLSDGTTAKLGVLVGRIGRLTLEGQPLRALSVSVSNQQVLAHIYEVERGPDGAERMKEKAVVTLQRGVQTRVDGAACGIATVEWLAPRPAKGGPALQQ